MEPKPLTVVFNSSCSKDHMPFLFRQSIHLWRPSYRSILSPLYFWRRNILCSVTALIGYRRHVIGSSSAALNLIAREIQGHSIRKHNVHWPSPPVEDGVVSTAMTLEIKGRPQRSRIRDDTVGWPSPDKKPKVRRENIKLDQKNIPRDQNWYSNYSGVQNSINNVVFLVQVHNRHACLSLLAS
jgi:hypothetical protein